MRKRRKEGESGGRKRGVYTDKRANVIMDR